MAKTYQWTNDTSLGHINVELDALWAQLDESRYEFSGPSASELQTNGTLTNLFVSPVIQLVDAATKIVRGSFIFPEYLIGVASTVDVSLRWWLMDNVASAANYEYQGQINKWVSPSGNPGTAILTVAATTVASPAASAYRLFSVDYSVSAVTWSNIVGLSFSFQRNGAAANDTATSDLYVMGTRLTFTPN